MLFRSDVIERIVDVLKDESEPFRKMAVETVDIVLGSLGAGDISERLEVRLIDGILTAFQEQTVQDVVLLNGFGTTVTALGTRTKPYIPQIVSTILFRLSNQQPAVRQQAADLITKIARVMKQCDDDLLMGKLGNVLYEQLGEEYPDVLGSLPDREISAGLAEVIKYGPIADMAFFEWLELHIDRLRAGDRTAMAQAVKRSVEIKAWVVSQDEKETGLRAVLNFGHTFGHAIEAGMGYGNWLHGEGVGAGMVMAAHLSQELGMVDAAFVARLTRLIERAGLPTRGAVLDAQDNAGAYLEHMRVDKKAEAGEIRFVLIDGPGKATMRGAPDALVRQVIDWCCAPA